MRKEDEKLAIDRMDWHYGSENFPEAIPAAASGTHIGMFLAWVINNNLEGELHRSDSIESIQKVRAREMTGTEFLIKECDEKFWEDDLNAQGLEFARYYYESNTYFSDYENALLTDEPTIYHINDSWPNFDKLSPYIDRAFSKWRLEKNEA